MGKKASEREKLKSKTSSHNSRGEIAKKRVKIIVKKDYFSFLAQPEFNESILAMKSGFLHKVVCSGRQKIVESAIRENCELSQRVLSTD